MLALFTAAVDPTTSVAAAGSQSASTNYGPALVTAAVALCGTLLAAIVAARQLHLTQRRLRLQATLDFYNALVYAQQKNRAQLAKRFPGGRAITEDEVKGIATTEPDILHALQSLLGALERFSAGVRYQVLDKALAKQLACSTILGADRRWRHYMEAVRNGRVGSTGRPSNYEHLYWLVREFGADGKEPAAADIATDRMWRWGRRR